MEPGSQWRAAGATTQVVVVRPPSRPGELWCAGAPMVPLEAGPDEVAGAAGGPTGDPLAVGKRYHLESAGLEVLCTQAGPGPLAWDGQPLEMKSAKPLPASD